MVLNPRITDWRGQHVWLIGASTGIGRATAALLHRRGAQVTLSARSAAALDAFVTEHPGAQALPLDTTDAHALRAAVQSLLQQHGRIDLAMYCAGHYRPMTATDFDLADALRHQQINVVGALNLLDAVLPPLLRQAAAGQPAYLSLVASVAGYRGLPNALAYGPTKAALINLAEVLYLDLHTLGAGVSLINPGFVETPLTAPNRFHMPALITPQAAADLPGLRGVYAAYTRPTHASRTRSTTSKACRPAAASSTTCFANSTSRASPCATSWPRAMSCS